MFQTISDKNLKKIEKLKNILKEECQNSKENNVESIGFLLNEDDMRAILSDKDISEDLFDNYMLAIQKNHSFLINIKEEELLDRIIDFVKDEYRPPNYTRFEKARMVGARALQISFGAPILIDVPDNMLDPVDIAMLEFENGLINMSIVKK